MGLYLRNFYRVISRENAAIWRFGRIDAGKNCIAWFC